MNQLFHLFQNIKLIEIYKIRTFQENSTLGTSEVTFIAAENFRKLQLVNTLVQDNTLRKKNCKMKNSYFKIIFLEFARSLSLPVTNPKYKILVLSFNTQNTPAHIP